jgi:putative ABC transport system substrate-binding protein
MPEIGFLNSGSKDQFSHLLKAFLHGLQLKGYKRVRRKPRRPKEVRVRVEWANGDYSKLEGKASALVDENVGLIVATGGIGAARAAAKVGSNLPILYASGRRAAAQGDPRRNAKALYLGMSTRNVEDHERYKRLRHLLGPRANIYQLINRGSPVYLEEGHWSKPLTAGTVSELKAAFRKAVDDKADAILVSGDPFFHTRRADIVKLAKRHKLLACYPWREYVEAGGLMSQGPNLVNTYRRLGVWAAMVLHGTKPEDLPDAEAGHREFVINLRTAKQLRIPPDKLSELLVMADAVIQ